MMSSYQFKWSLVSWRLPLDTRESRREARRVKRSLARFSQCGRWGNLREGACLCMAGQVRVLAALGAVPSDGELRVLGVTDRQIGMSSVIFGKRRV